MRMSKPVWVVMNIIEIALGVYFIPLFWRGALSYGQGFWMFLGATFALVIIWMWANIMLIKGWEWWR